MKKEIDDRLAKNVIIILSALLFSALFFDKMPQMVIMIALSYGTIRFILKNADEGIRPAMVTLFLLVFFVQIALSLSIYSQTLGTKYYGFSFKGDDYVYGDFGTIVGNLWRHNIFPSLKELEIYNLVGENILPQGYQFYNAVMFYLFGIKAGQILLIINCFLHAAVIIPVYFIFKELNIKKNVMITGFMLFLFWPSTFYWSLFNFKEPAILFVIISIFGLSLHFRSRVSYGSLFLILLFNLVAWLLKQYLIVVSIAILLYVIIFVKWKGKALAFIIALFVIEIVQLVKEPLLLQPIYVVGAIPTIATALRRGSALSGYSGYFANLLTFTYPKLFAYLPFGISATLVLPFLARPFTITQVASNIESLIWWCMIPFLLNGIWISIRSELKKTFPILFVFFSWTVILAMTQGNMGTLLRQKAIVCYAGFIFIILSIDRVLDKISKGVLAKDG